jgi:hypothetical protein
MMVVFALFRVHKKVLMVVVIDATTPEEKPLTHIQECGQNRHL